MKIKTRFLPVSDPQMDWCTECIGQISSRVEAKSMIEWTNSQAQCLKTGGKTTRRAAAWPAVSSGDKYQHCRKWDAPTEEWRCQTESVWTSSCWITTRFGCPYCWEEVQGRCSEGLVLRSREEQRSLRGPRGPNLHSNVCPGQLGNDSLFVLQPLIINCGWTCWNLAFLGNLSWMKKCIPPWYMVLYRVHWWLRWTIT